MSTTFIHLLAASLLSGSPEPSPATSTPRDAAPDDADRDGVTDATEVERGSDPHVPGLFPGAYPHIPEPMVFDLVRGLGAKKGEFEVNALAHASFAPYHGIAWAPEIEWAFADRRALEFELPMHDGRVHALKLAVQGSVKEQRPKFIHGWQLIGEYGLASRHGELSTLYLAGLRVRRRLALFMMLGPRASVATRTFGVKLLTNPSIFFDVAEVATLGIESNVELDGRRSSLKVIPQVHVQVGRHVRLQLGGGLELTAAGLAPLAALRVIIE